MTAKEFVENADGVHLMSPHQGEYTLCGDAFDMASASGGEHGQEFDFKPTRKRVVTCERCSTIINHCRGVSVFTGRESL